MILVTRQFKDGKFLYSLSGEVVLFKAFHKFLNMDEGFD